jgi:hypothetical protein
LQKRGKVANQFSVDSADFATALGDCPPQVHEGLTACAFEQRNSGVNLALDAATWDEFTAHLPVPAE